MKTTEQPIYHILGGLKEERRRRINAFNSGKFCDNKTLARNIDILTKGILAMNKEIVLDAIDRSVPK